MAKTIGRLTAQQVDSLPPRSTPYSDGSNLYLDVKETGARSWAFIYRWDGKQRTAGLGKAGKRGVSLKDARRRAKERREMLDRKPPVDPLTMWRAAPATTVLTFGEAAKRLLERQEERGEGGKHPKHRSQWRSTLASLPASFRNLPIDKIGPQQVFDALDPVWARTPETGKRLRGRIATVLNFARGPGDQSPNPATSGWLKEKLGGVDTKLDRKSGERIARDHFLSLPYARVPDFIRRLRAEPHISARALEFGILNASRAGEAIGAKWQEIDDDTKTWTIPPQRLKTGRKTKQPHIIPLAPRSLEIVEAMREIRSGDHVFPGRFDGDPLSETAFFVLLRRMGVNATTHGFRASFRTWCADRATPFELAESALGHSSNAIVAAYQRSGLVERRRPLMESWSKFLSGEESATPNIVPFEPKPARVS